MKMYVVYSHAPGEKPIRLEKYEQDLTQQDLNLFLGDLIHCYNECPPVVKEQFKNMLDKEYYKQQNYDNSKR